ncbi:MAG TPA: efflux RND transporter periplasmic adaptor subunit [Candidatus Wallbacteria bacterium]|nr:efflux RND transporter periplasmic adaptor subunit [Candidatus Wallbacteria bacterium]
MPVRKFFIAAAAALAIYQFAADVSPAFAEDVNNTNEVTVYGSIQPSRKVAISARAAGTIEFLPPIEGAAVKSGEVVLQIDREDYELKADVIKSQLKLAEITKEQAAREFKRLDSLYESKAISQQAKDSAYFARERADANVGLMRSNLKVIEKTLRDTASRAPIGGMVSSRLLEAGEYVAPGQPVLEIVNIDSVKAHFKVPENYISRVGVGSTIEISAENDKNTKTLARVTSVNPIGDADNHVFEIIILIDNPGHVFKAGMFVKGLLKLEPEKSPAGPGEKK